MKGLISCLFVSCFFLFACQSGETETATTVEKPTSIETPATAETPPPAPETKAGTATSYLTTEVGNIPIYNSFDELEYLFNQKNDTTYIINFWATWCKPCVKELPYFEEVKEKYKDEKVQIVLVSLDFKRQLEKKLRPFLEERKLQSEVVVLTDSNSNGWIDRIDKDWDGAIPVTVVYNAKARQFVHWAFDDAAELETILKRFLAA